MSLLLIHDLKQQIERKEQRIAELERTLTKDAERYKHLKTNHCIEAADGDLGIKFYCDYAHWNDIDASIDAAIAAQKGEQV